MTKAILRSLNSLCARDISTINPQKDRDREFGYVDISAVDNVSKSIVSPQRTNGKLASVRARQIIRQLDVIVSTTRPNLNAVAIVPGELDGEICSTGFCVLRCGPELDPAYLFAFVQSEGFVRALSNLVQGALYPAVTDKQVFAQNIPWVPLKDQHRIANHLKAQLTEIEKVRCALALQQLETNTLADAIISQSINIAGTKHYSLGEVLEEVKNGVGDDWASFSVWGATRDGLAPAKEPPGKKPERYKPAFPGTVFYNPMRILIGSIAFVDDDDKPGITSPDYVVLTGKKDIVDSRWFYFWLRSPLGKQCITSLARGAVRERMLFNRLAEGYIELPDFKLQQAASKALAELKHLRKAIEIKMNEINLLPTKILSQAFEM